jgi:serine/threonine protein kinase
MNASNYRVIRQVGGGQEGRIFLAERDQHFYALKELINSPSQGEINLLSDIKHPAVIGFHEAIAGDAVTLVLEYASEGRTATIQAIWPASSVETTPKSTSPNRWSAVGCCS